MKLYLSVTIVITALSALGQILAVYHDDYYASKGNKLCDLVINVALVCWGIALWAGIE